MERKTYLVKAWHSHHATLKKRVKPETIYIMEICQKIKSRKCQRLLLIRIITILTPIFYHCVNLIIILGSIFIFRAHLENRQQKLKFYQHKQQHEIMIVLRE